MHTDQIAPRLLGAAFLIVIVTSLSAGLLLSPAASGASATTMLLNIYQNPTFIRLSLLGHLLTSCGIVALAALLYIVLHQQSEIIALIALGCWLAEAICLALSQLGTAALIPLSLDFVRAGAPGSSFYQALGQFLYSGVYSQAYTLHMWFYCTGGLLWYYQFFQSRYIPRAVAGFGLLAVSLGLVGIVLEFFGNTVPIWIFLPILPFELAIGLWLLLKGIRAGSDAPARASRPLGMPASPAQP